jgi:hypothetical protein
MPKKIWDMTVGRPVEDSPGLKTSGEYSGLYKQRNATALAPIVDIHGTKAQEHFNISVRQSMNEGAYFSGYLAERRVAHVTLFIGLHPTHGLSAYAKRPTSHAGNRIEIITVAGSKIISSRNDFFGQLLEAEIPEIEIEAFCTANWYA